METQVPYHNRKMWAAFIDFAFNYDPTSIIGIGDHLDCPGISRWNRGTAMEWAGLLHKEADVMKKMFGELRTTYDGPLGVHEGNHERRMKTYAAKNSPGFGILNPTPAQIMDYKSFAITELPDINPVAKGWVTTHDFGGLKKTISKISGQTAMAYARASGFSVVMGHTHRLGHSREMVGGRLLQGVETGHMMGKADYLSFPNWAGGWAVMEISNSGLVHVETVDCSATGKVSFRGGIGD